MKYWLIIIGAGTWLICNDVLANEFVEKVVGFTSEHRGEKFSETQKIRVDESDAHYFISSRCALDLEKSKNCVGLIELKKKWETFQPDGFFEPAKKLCYWIGGAYEKTTITSDENSLNTSRCLFPEDNSFVSMDVLRSFDGKQFILPSKDSALEIDFTE